MHPPDSDTGYAAPRWEFDEEVSRVFDDMLDRSIPQYETMREAVTLVASAFLTSVPAVLDLGCSHGDALARLRALDPYGAGRYLGLEISEPMVEAARVRFVGDPNVVIAERDLRAGLPREFSPFDVVLSVLTLMFVPTNYRQRILTEAAEVLHGGGALILVEKVLGEAPKIDDVLAANYHRKKVDSGYTPEDVERKRLSLEGVLVPMPASFNEQMLARAGFREVDCFWRWMNFAAWVAVR